MSHEEFEGNQREIYYDRKFDASLAAVAEAMQEEAAGAGLGDLGGDEGIEGLGDLGGEEIEGDIGDLGGDEPAAEEPAAPEIGDDPLLASPGRREDNGYVTPGSKGKVYHPVKKGRDNRTKGAMKRHRASVAGINMDPRKTFPGKSGYGGLDSLAKGMFESRETNYDNGFTIEEENLQTTNSEVKRLLESLGNSTETKNETKTQ